MTLTTGEKIIVDETRDDILRKVIEYKRAIYRRFRGDFVDLATILGLVVAAVGILAGQAIEGGSVLQILQPTAAMIVFGGTLGATMIGFPIIRDQTGRCRSGTRL
jgi:hypothetical protein